MFDLCWKISKRVRGKGGGRRLEGEWGEVKCCVDLLFLLDHNAIFN